MADSEEFRAQIRRATELLEGVVADPSVLEVMPEHERIRFVNAAGDVFCPDVDERRRRSKARQRRQRSARPSHATKRCSPAPASARSGRSRSSPRPTCSRPTDFAPEDVAGDGEGRR